MAIAQKLAGFSLGRADLLRKAMGKKKKDLMDKYGVQFAEGCEKNGIDKKKAEEEAARMLQGDFTLEDFLEQVRTIKKMGSLRDLVDRIPMLAGRIPAGVNLDDKELVRIEAMIQSMTPDERKSWGIIEID